MIDYREDNKWTVYVHISPSNKYYVGITSQKYINTRWRNGKGYIKNQYFYRAIQKYGWNNFQHEIVANNLTKEEACNFEKILINKLNSNDYHYGYNISSGGESGSAGLYGEKNPNYGHYWTNEQKKRMSEKRKGSCTGDKNPNYGKPLSDEVKLKLKISRANQIITEETKKKMSTRLKNRWKDKDYREMHSGENHCCYGRVGEKHPMFNKHGKENPNSKAVICLDDNTAYHSAKDAANILKINYSKLCMCCRGERNSCGKTEDGRLLHWQYYEDYLKENNLTDEEARKRLFFIE